MTTMEGFDNRWVEFCYLVLAIQAWSWATSQAKIAFRRPSWWRWNTTSWMLSKASFFTLVGSVWWFNWFDMTAFNVAITVLTIAHTIAYIHWIRLPQEPLINNQVKTFPPHPAEDTTA